jgi:hypothetical protein
VIAEIVPPAAGGAQRAILRVAGFSALVRCFHDIEGFFDDTDAVGDSPLAAAALEMVNIPADRE